MDHTLDEVTPETASAVLDGLPSELLHLIASNDKEVYRTLALAGIRKFFVTLTPSTMMDYRIKFGYSVKITGKSIMWSKARLKNFGFRYVNGDFHRTDGPAVELTDGTKMWYVNGVPHRVDDRPAVERANGTKEWYINGERHRVDGPAIERSDGTKKWYVWGHIIK